MKALPEPPPPIVLVDPDGGEHELRYEVWLAPTGICVELKETGVEPGEGFMFSALGDHDADVDVLLRRLRAIAEREVGRCYLEPSSIDGHLELAESDVRGRFVWNDGGDNDLYDVVVDGKTLTWEEFGRAFSSYEGWQFHITMADPVDEVVASDTDVDLGGFDTDGIDAEILAFPTPAAAAPEPEPARSTAAASPSLRPADLDAALAWERGRNDRLSERAVGQIRYEVDIEGQAVTMYECRPPWDPAYGTEWTRFPVVRFRYTKSRREWVTYWRDRNLKFHRYPPFAPAEDLQDLIDQVEGDRSGIFWG